MSPAPSITAQRGSGTAPRRAPSGVRRSCRCRSRGRRPAGGLGQEPDDEHHWRIYAPARRNGVIPELLTPRSCSPHDVSPTRQLAARTRSHQGRRRGAGRRAPVHVAARRPGRRGPHGHLGAAGSRARGRALARGVLRTDWSAGLTVLASAATTLRPSNEDTHDHTDPGDHRCQRGRRQGRGGRTRRRLRRPDRARRRRSPAPYERPPLSKAVLRGEAEPDSARVHDEGFYEERAIELVHDRAVALDVDGPPGRAGGRRRHRASTWRCLPPAPSRGA